MTLDDETGLLLASEELHDGAVAASLTCEQFVLGAAVESLDAAAVPDSVDVRRESWVVNLTPETMGLVSFAPLIASDVGGFKTQYVGVQVERYDGPEPDLEVVNQLMRNDDGDTVLVSQTASGMAWPWGSLANRSSEVDVSSTIASDSVTGTVGQLYVAQAGQTVIASDVTIGNLRVFAAGQGNVQVSDVEAIVKALGQFQATVESGADS